MQASWRLEGAFHLLCRVSLHLVNWLRAASLLINDSRLEFAVLSSLKKENFCCWWWWMGGPGLSLWERKKLLTKQTSLPYIGQGTLLLKSWWSWWWWWYSWWWWWKLLFCFFLLFHVCIHAHDSLSCIFCANLHKAQICTATRHCMHIKIISVHKELHVCMAASCISIPPELHKRGRSI